MIGEAIEYPLEGEDLLGRFLVGGVLYLLAPFVVPVVLLGGYSVAVVRAVATGRSEPPAFDDWEEYLGDGLAVLVVTFVYWLPGLVVTGLAALVFVLASLLSSGDPGLLGVPVVALIGVAGILGVVYSLVVGYVLPAAIVNFARTGRLGAAFDVETLRTVVTDGGYATAWIVAGLVVLVSISVGFALSVVLVGFLVLFYGQVAATYVHARATMDALDVSPEPPAPPSAPEEEEEQTGEDTTGDHGSGDVDEEDGIGDGDEDGGESEGDEDDEDDGDGRALVDVDGVGPATAESLREAGYETVTDLRAATRDELTDVDGIGPARADQLKRDVDDA